MGGGDGDNGLLRGTLGPSAVAVRAHKLLIASIQPSHGWIISPGIRSSPKPLQLSTDTIIEQ